MNDPLTNDRRDSRVLELYERVLEVEQRLIPTGLHIFGRPSSSTETVDLLRMIASFDRPELGLRAITDLVAESLGFVRYVRLLEESRTSSQRLAERETVETIVNKAMLRFTQSGVDSAAELLHESSGVRSDQSIPIFKMLEEISQKLKQSSELDGLMSALRGEYVEPGPGADIVQNPLILPTGRNTHAVNPYVVPSPFAVRRAEPVARALLTRYLDEMGRYPETIAMVLWGTDNIKTEGEAVAQALWLLGVRPRRDSLNRATDVEVINLEELGRPRIDVVMTVSGIFRDLFGTTMGLLDRAVRTVADLEEPDEMNFVRKHVKQQLVGGSISRDEAAVRVFSNAAGNYGTNVNFMVLESQWDDPGELGDLFVNRKCFAYGRDSRGLSIEGREAKALYERALAGTEVTFQNIDTTEVGIIDVDHYFEYLGGMTRAVEKRSGSRPQAYLADSLSQATKIRTLEETVRLEARTKTLNPKWYEGMLAHGFSGVAEIEHQVTNTFGWSATADAVDKWVYDQVAETFVLDDQMLDRLRALNPHSARTLVGRLLEAAGRGFWDADSEALNRIQSAYTDLEDQLEGVSR
jgi:magnesium chelatase subunit H